MIEPTIYMQLGLTDDRYHAVMVEINSILKTKETTGNMMLMVTGSRKLLNENEKMYAVYMIAKEDIVRKLMATIPPVLAAPLKKILEE